MPLAQIGTRIQIELVYRSGEREPLAFELVADPQADYQAGFLGASTPIAQAILGEKAGTLVPYFTDEFQAIHILSVESSTRQPDPDSAVQRGKALQQTLDEIEYRDALLFAASANTKWGSYDPDSLPPDLHRTNETN